MTTLADVLSGLRRAEHRVGQLTGEVRADAEFVEGDHKRDEGGKFSSTGGGGGANPSQAGKSAGWAAAKHRPDPGSYKGLRYEYVTEKLAAIDKALESDDPRAALSRITSKSSIPSVKNYIDKILEQLGSGEEKKPEEKKPEEKRPEEKKGIAGRIEDMSRHEKIQYLAHDAHSIEFAKEFGISVMGHPGAEVTKGQARLAIIGLPESHREFMRDRARITCVEMITIGGESTTGLTGKGSAAGIFHPSYMGDWRSAGSMVGTIEVAEKYMAGGRARECWNVVNTTTHEFGHALDRALGHPSEDHSFRVLAHQAKLKLSSTELQNAQYWFINSHETWVEAYATGFGDRGGGQVSFGGLDSRRANEVFGGLIEHIGKQIDDRMNQVRTKKPTERAKEERSRRSARAERRAKRNLEKDKRARESAS